MQDAPNGFKTPLEGLTREAWKAKIAEIARENGSYRALGDDHAALLIRGSATLIVTFELVDRIQEDLDEEEPVGFGMAKELGWSHLCLLADRETWFRDPAVYAFFDELTDDAFFEEFDTVLFYGAGSCGYAAAAFSLAAPGATVIALQPQATLDPRVTGWDRRFMHMRRTSFTDRYGYAPDMIEGAGPSFVFFNPDDELDAMHAALFTRPNVTQVQCRDLPGKLDNHFMAMHLLYRIFAKAAAGKLTAESFARLWRARREYGPYLRNLLQRAEDAGRPELAAIACRSIFERIGGRRFRRRLREYEDRGLIEPQVLPEQHGATA